MKLWPFRAERRAAARRESSLAAEIVVRESFSGKPLAPPCTARVLNLSHRGCCLALDRLDCGGFHLHRCLEAPQDYVIQLRLAKPNGGPPQYRGVVRWLNREMTDNRLPFRVGLAFDQDQQH